MYRVCFFSAFVAMATNLHADRPQDDTNADASRVENVAFVSLENLGSGEALPKLKTEVIAPMTGLWTAETRIPPLPFLEPNNDAPSVYASPTQIFPPPAPIDCQCFVPEISYLTESRPTEFRPATRKLPGLIPMEASYPMPEFSYLAESRPGNFPPMKPKLSRAVPRHAIDSSSELSYLSVSRPR